MKRLLISLALAAVALPGSVLADAELNAVRARVSAEFEEIQPENIFPSPIEGWYTIRRGAIVAYVSADGRYLLQGDLIDLDEQTNLSEQERNKARIDMMKSVDDDQFITFSPDKVSHSVSIFTDIDCGYCRRLHNQIDEYLAKGIEIRYLLYPRNGPTSDSWAKAEQVWCASDRNNALTMAKQDQSFESRTCDSSAVSEHYALGRDSGLRGTPTIILEDGTLVNGYLTPDRLAAALAAQ